MIAAAHLGGALVVVICLAAAALGLAQGAAWAKQMLLVARSALALQIGLGLLLTANGYVGRPSHYLAAFAAAGVLWFSQQQARRSTNAARSLALGCLIAALLSLLALGLALLGRF